MTEYGRSLENAETLVRRILSRSESGAVDEAVVRAAAEKTVSAVTADVDEEMAIA